MPEQLMVVFKWLVFVCGMLLIYFTLASAVRMLVLPRSDNVWLTRVVFLNLLRLFELRLKIAKTRTYELRDSVMAFFSPIALLTMPVVWLTLVMIGYTMIFWALGVEPVYNAFRLAGSSLLTLGFAVEPGTDWPMLIFIFTDAIIGLGLVALLISYLPTMYGAFSRREKYVAMLEVRAGAPPSAVTMIQRFYRNQGIGYFEDFWASWEEWFVEVEESHTSLAPVNFFRSPQPQRSWITAAGVVLDSIALVESSVDTPRNIRGVLCMRAGFLALRSIADFFRIPHDKDPKPDDPISISRDEFDEAWEELEMSGISMVADKEQAWRDFAGWRVNYDTVLISLARLMQAPYAPWSSDRSVPHITQSRMSGRTFIRYKKNAAPR